MEVLIVPWIFKEQVSIVEKISLWTKLMFFFRVYSDVQKYTAIPCVIDGRWAYKLESKEKSLSDLIDIDRKYVLAIQLYQSESKVKLNPMRYYDFIEYSCLFRGRKYLLVQTNNYLKSDKFVEAQL